MRRALLLSLALTAIALSGCTSDGDGTDDDTEGEPIIAEGQSLGDWTTSMEGGPLAGAETISPDLEADCSSVPTAVGSHPFTIPDQNDDGVAWEADTLRITLVPDNAASVELDLYLFDADGGQLGANTESDLLGDDPYRLSVSGLSPGDYEAQVHACSGTTGYVLDVVGAMVASEDVFDN